MTPAALHVGKRQRERARRRARIAVPLGQRRRGVTIRRHARGETEAHRGTRRQTHALPQAQDRIEDDARRARERAAIERDRVLDASPAPDE